MWAAFAPGLQIPRGCAARTEPKLTDDLLEARHTNHKLLIQYRPMPLCSCQRTVSVIKSLTGIRSSPCIFNAALVREGPANGP